MMCVDADVSVGVAYTSHPCWQEGPQVGGLAVQTKEMKDNLSLMLLDQREAMNEKVSELNGSQAQVEVLL